MTRFARKRSWSLWFLCCAIIVLLAHTLWNTALYGPGPDPAEEYREALKKSVSALFVAVLLTLGSVLVIQMLSGVNLAQAGATDQAEYLKNVLEKESERASSITEEFDAMYTSRAQTIAEVLSEDPQLIDTDSLYSLDENFSGSGLRVFNTDSELLASDEILHHVVDESIIGSTAVSSGTADSSGSGAPSDAADPGADSTKRYYRAVMVDGSGRTTGCWKSFMPNVKASCTAR